LWAPGYESLWFVYMHAPGGRRYQVDITFTMNLSQSCNEQPVCWTHNSCALAAYLTQRQKGVALAFFMDLEIANIQAQVHQYIHADHALQCALALMECNVQALASQVLRVAGCTDRRILSHSTQLCVLQLLCSILHDQTAGVACKQVGKEGISGKACT